MEGHALARSGGHVVVQREDSLSPTTEVESEVESVLEQSDNGPPTASAMTPPALEPSGTNKILLLFSGPRLGAGTLKEYLESYNFIVADFDITNGSQYDILDDAVWDPLWKEVQARGFCAAIASPPCSTFSRVRNVPGGPPPLRGAEGIERYGLRGLRPKDLDEVRKHNLLAVRTANIIACLNALGCPTIVEQPAMRHGEVSMLKLDEFKCLLQGQGIQHTIGPQCQFGASASKRTSWITHLINFSDMSPDCKHPRRTWYCEGTGAAVDGPHPPARGKLRHFKSIDEAVSARPAPTCYTTTALARYTPLLNKYLAIKIKLALSQLSLAPPRRSLRASSTNSAVPSNLWDQRTGREQVIFRQSLRGQPKPDEKTTAERQAIGGLRDTAKSLKQLSVSAAFGKGLGAAIRDALIENMAAHHKARTPEQSWVECMCRKIGAETAPPAPPEAVDCIRRILIRETNHCTTVSPKGDEDCTTDINADLLDSWRKAACDPDDAVCEWLRSGAPAGLRLFWVPKFFKRKISFLKFLCFISLFEVSANQLNSSKRNKTF